jgi:hypothetical protein
VNGGNFGGTFRRHRLVAFRIGGDLRPQTGGALERVLRRSDDDVPISSLPRRRIMDELSGSVPAIVEDARVGRSGDGQADIGSTVTSPGEARAASPRFRRCRWTLARSVTPQRLAIAPATHLALCAGAVRFRQLVEIFVTSRGPTIGNWRFK